MRNHGTQIAGALLLVFCAGISKGNSPSQQVDTVRYCEVLSHFKEYDDKAVVTTSFAGVSFHSDALFDPACMSADKENRSVDLALPNGWNSTKIGKKLENIFRHNQIGRITFEGIFHSSKQQYGGDGARFRFTMRRLISVEKVSKKEAMAGSSKASTNPKQ
jgi:hypothetical protein